MGLVYLQVYDPQVREPRERGGHITGSSGRRSWRLTAGYCCEARLLLHHRQYCADTRRLRTENEVITNRAKTLFRKTDHLLLLRYLCGSRTSACTAHMHETASASVR